MLDLALSTDVLSLCLLAITVALVAVAGALASLTGTPRVRQGLHVAALVLLFGLTGAGLALGAPRALCGAELGVAAACLLLAALRLPAVRSGALALGRSVWLPWAALLVISLATAAWQFRWLDPDLAPVLPLPEPASEETLDLEEHPDLARTDRGTVVPVYTVATHDGLVASEEELYADWGRRLRLLRVGPPTCDSNCHGWVFTDGQFRVRGDQVELILRENGYRPVGRPGPDDLVVYRDRDGAVVHSGIVRAELSDGTPLVESKWGNLGRYLHTAEAQTYGPRYTFYRSSRPGHLLHGLTTPPGR